MTGATGPAGGTAITQADAFTFKDLQTLYATCGTVTEGGVTYNPMTATGSQVQINLYLPYSLPQAANLTPTDTALLWWAGLGINPPSTLICAHTLIVAGPDTGQRVREDDGAAVSTDPNGYMPFSVGQWIGQRNGIDDRRHGAVLHKINGISPFDNGNPATGALNTAFGSFSHEVYNVVQYDHVVNTGDGNFDSALAHLLVGTGSALCQDSFTITGYGFAELGTQTTDSCGATTNNLRAFGPGDPV